MILFLDTSTGNCRIWLGENSFKKELNRNMARDILKFLEDSLKNIGKDYKDLEGIGFFAGPGSFTGLRIGASVANTLADGLNIPIVAIKKEDENDDWRQKAFEKLKNNENDKIALPFYGRDANITKPRK
ncbi:MAG: tRNA (adenosine(37)-N6)-threonylcarbamoyltransferase complex dimerization subunit type 1 TsaB [Candidatus Nanogingivalaceae bacterium]|nr:tRNA (adenosine(37)-N6)-threonylcarbamoyltransferase complex dimerization subunit type 1 TsaB [Candidatus Nanogingivalaceae bacterium]